MALAQRQLSAETLARSCLERVAELEPRVQAFAHIDGDQLLAAARVLDQGPLRGPLHGLPIGAKDIMDTRDAPTAYGSAIYRGHQPRADAASIALARECGALIFGKTVTTEFACRPPGPTTNPRNFAHTPGGSSSGSAAAVACGMLPAAFGTQTGGSVIRPAAYCGVAGYKPSFGMLPRVGTKMISDTLDTIGLFATTVPDVALVMAGLTGRDALRVPEALATPKLAVCRTPQWAYAEKETRELFENLQVKTEIKLPQPFNGLTDAHAAIWDYELARCLADEYRHHRETIREPLRSQVARGWGVAPKTYDTARELATQCRRTLPDALGEYDALIVPSAPGYAPKGQDTTGDPVFNRIWTLLHAPAVHVPLRTGPGGLPLGVQLVGRIGDDARVLAAAAWVERHLKG
jgi:Asp-tRNA(Asn)/Glu-tRNA(Gln) amidotransferase A subunit family amidase